MNMKEKLNEKDAIYFLRILYYKDFMSVVNISNRIIVHKPIKE